MFELEKRDGSLTEYCMLADSNLEEIQPARVLCEMPIKSPEDFTSDRMSTVAHGKQLALAPTHVCVILCNVIRGRFGIGLLLSMVKLS